MKIEVREDSVFITGYVNAVERLSKPIREVVHGRLRTFLERIRAGAFKKALSRNDDVLVLLNHNPERVLASTKEGTAVLEEDTIGLRAEITITDKEVVEKARSGKLSGWSFGFTSNDDEFTTEGKNDIRTVNDLDLPEVSILDDTASPAYYGTSIHARSENSKNIEVRSEGLNRNDEPEISLEAISATVADLVADKVTERVLAALEKNSEGNYQNDNKNEEARSVSALRERLNKLTKKENSK